MGIGLYLVPLRGGLLARDLWQLAIRNFLTEPKATSYWPLASAFGGSWRVVSEDPNEALGNIEPQIHWQWLDDDAKYDQ